MSARCLWSAVIVLLLAVRVPTLAQPALKTPTSAEHIIEPPDIVTLEGSKSLADLTLGLIGKHRIREDGTISLGAYGNLNVTGMTLSQAQAAITNRLSDRLKNPDISLRMENVNDKVYYVIIRSADHLNDASEQVIRTPLTGNETVLDAIARINDLPAICSKRKMWLVRPTKKGGCENLPVDWLAIVKSGTSATNHTLCPGDQIHIVPEPEPRKHFSTRFHLDGLIHLQGGSTIFPTPPQ